MAKLKVFRTPAGFHDAYVAAASQKAALAAWGSDVDLFARGIAEAVIDPALIEAPLSRPGEVIKVARTMADAAPEPEPRRKKERTVAKKVEPVPPKPKPPRPTRTKIEAAESALTAAEQHWKEERAHLRQEEEALAKRRRVLDREADEQRTLLEEEAAAARRAYDAAVAAWDAA